ncbi:MAG: hypothetical protein KDB71_10825 [Mycobacterium sp.]|nr:hypothetical protein [Mycobacterium sp.]
MADWRDDYRAKLMTADQAAQLVRSGDSIFVGGGSSIPLEFSQALADRSAELENVDFYAALALFPLKVLDGEMKGRINYHTIFTGRFERMKAPEGNVNQLSVHLAETDRFIRERAKPTVLSVNVSPPDKHGWMTFGPCGGMGQHEALKLASTTIVTVQPTQPRVYGEFNTIHVSQVDAIVETEIPIASLPSAPPTDLENQIASHVVPLVPDGATIQIGIGGVPGAVAHSLAEKKNLGIHTEMFNDAMFSLVQAGAVTGACKNIHPGKVVFSFAAGGPDLMNYVDDNPECVILPLSRAINDHDCGKNDSFVSINTCLMVSLTGQVAAEAVNWIQISGTGGQLDLVRAARNSKGGRSFFVMPSTRRLKGGERISNIAVGLPAGTPVTTPRTDIQYVATEYGCVNLRYLSNVERIRALISIAHPDFREDLRAGVLAEGIAL